MNDIFYHFTSQKFDDRAGCELALGEVNAEVRFVEASHDPEDVLVAFLQSMANNDKVVQVNLGDNAHDVATEQLCHAILKKSA